MKRKLGAAVALAAVAMLAGCDGGTVVELTPDAEIERTVGDGDREYVVDLSAELGAEKGEPDVEGVEVVGYDVAGREVCRADVGDAETGVFGTSGGSESVRCDVFPSILAVSVDRITEGEGGEPNPGRAVFYVGVYVGQGEGTEVLGWEVESGPHEYETGVHETYPIGMDEEPSLSPTVDEGTVAFAKCRQHVSDGDLSALEGNPPWVVQNPEPPDVERNYTLSVNPTTVSDEGEHPARSLSDLPPATRDLIREARAEMEREDETFADPSTGLSRSEYLREHDALVDWSVEEVDDVPGQDRETESRRVATWDDRHADCREFAYDGQQGHRVTYVVVVDGEPWKVELAHVDEWSGEIDVPTVDEDVHREEEDEEAPTVEPVVAR